MYIRIDDKIHSDIKETGYCFDGQEAFKYFGIVDTVNIFVGANNSGKSRFLRGLLKSKGITLISQNNFELIAENIKLVIHKSFESLLEYHGNNLGRVSINSNISSNFFSKSHEWLINKNQSKNNILIITFDRPYFENILTSILKAWETDFIPLKDYLCEKISELTLATEIIVKINSRNENPPSLNQARIYVNDGLILPLEETKNLINNLKELSEITFQTAQPTKKHFIPILRSTNTLLEKIKDTPSKKISSDIFEYSTYKNYKFDKCDENIIIYHTGLNFYQRVQDTRNSRKDIRNRFSSFEKFLSENFFHGQEIDIVALSEKDEEKQHISLFIDGEERDIHELGDGIQAIILLMYPIFMAEDESWIFIEEPEINLHPSLQRVFIEQILHNEVIKNKKLKFFFTTHSNHLLDITLDFKEGVSIFTFEKLKDENNNRQIKIKNVKNSDTGILHLLGVNNSSVFMANCSIWVEGICDRVYIKAYLKALIEHNKIESNLKEDIHYTFFEYAGSNVSHYLFDSPNELNELSQTEKDKILAQFLSNKIFLVSDRDLGKDKKHSFLTKQQNKNFKYHILPVREIENLLSPIQIKKYLPEIYRRIDAKMLSSKKIEQDDYRNEYLGKFLQKKLKGVDISTLLAPSKTLKTKYKNELVRMISDNIKWEEMSEDAKSLAKEVYQFIKESNPEIKAFI